MRTTLFSLFIVAGAPVGCGGGGGSTATDTTTTDPTNTTTAPTGTTSETAGTTDGPVTGTDANTMGTNDTTSPPVTSTTEEPVTTTLTTAPTSETEPATTTTGETSATSEGTDDTSSTDPSTTGGDPGGACEKDDDCTLLSDCCRCEAIAVGDPIPECPMMECLLPQCDALGIDEVSCRFGTCVAEKLNCDAAAIACDSLPPECPKGTLPGVNEDNTCWTNGCVPIDLCNVVPDCTLCPNGQMCVVDETLFGPKRRCEPIPADCNGKPDCACAGVACDQGFESCTENDDGLLCFCPNC